MTITESKAARDARHSEPPRTFGRLLDDVRIRLDVALPQWLAPRIDAADAVSEEVGAAASAVRDLTLRGGKRLRAALVAVGYATATEGNDEQGLRDCESAMLAVELLQTYLLIHDDWMDGDAVRRGGPAVHVILRERLGSSQAGDSAAVLAGDLAAAYAQEALLESPLCADHVLRAARAFAQTQNDVVRGQLSELRAAVRTGPMPSVETTHALKTASYTVTGPLVLGATLAGGDPSLTSALERFGRPLGIAFQLRDDILGTFGDPVATGKPVWNDIRQGKRTALIAELEQDPAARGRLARVFGSYDADDVDVEALVSFMKESGAVARVEARAQACAEEARRVLEELTPRISPLARSWFDGATMALVERRA
jgi:geranylgeranyl diphosphate synthase type I